MIGSVVLNVVLGGVLVASVLQPTRHIAPSQDVVAALQSLGEAQGLSDALVGDLVIAAIRSELNVSTPFEYWHSPAMQSMEAEVAAATLDEKTRDALIARFGEQAHDMPAFARAFQPFADRYPTLPQTKQVALQRLLLKQREKAVQAARSGGDAYGQFTADVEAEAGISSLLTSVDGAKLRFGELEASGGEVPGEVRSANAVFEKLILTYISTPALMAERRRMPACRPFPRRI